MSKPWHFPLCIASLKRHLGSRCSSLFHSGLSNFSMQWLRFTALWFASLQIIGHTISRQRMSRNVWCKCWNCCWLPAHTVHVLIFCFQAVLNMLLHVTRIIFGAWFWKGKYLLYTMAAVSLHWRKAEDVLQTPPLTRWCGVDLFLATDSKQQTVCCGDWGE